MPIVIRFLKSEVNKSGPDIFLIFGDNSTGLKDVTNPTTRKNLSAFSSLGNQVLENNEALFFNYLHKRKLGFGIYNKKTKQLMTRDAFKNDYLSSIFSAPIGISADNNKLISLLHPARILYLMENSPDFVSRVRQEDSALYGLMKDLDETKNQLLMTFVLK